MPVHRSVTPSIKFAITHLYTWVERSTVGEKNVSLKNTIECPQPWLKLRLLQHGTNTIPGDYALVFGWVICQSQTLPMVLRQELLNFECLFQNNLPNERKKKQ